MVSGLDCGHARADCFDDSSAFVAENGGEDLTAEPGISAKQVGVADARARDAHRDFSGSRGGEFYILDNEGLIELP